jgi:hypothetical protein
MYMLCEDLFERSTSVDFFIFLFFMIIDIESIFETTYYDEKVKL